MVTTYLVILVSVLIVTLAIIAGILIILVHNHILNTSKKNYKLLEPEKFDDVDLDAFATEKRIKKIKEKKIADNIEKKKSTEEKQNNKTVKADIENDLKNRLQEELLKSASSSQTQQNNLSNQKIVNERQGVRVGVNTSSTTSTMDAQARVKSEQQRKEDEYFRKIAEERRRTAQNINTNQNVFAQTNPNQTTQSNTTKNINGFNTDLTKKDKKQSKKELENELQAKLLRAKSELNRIKNNSGF